MQQSKSEATRWALFKTLKTLLGKRPLDKITIKMLTDACGFNRQTFYYHFQDIYGLLEWGLAQEMLLNAKKDLALDNWQMKLKILLDYVQENHELCLTIIDSTAREALERSFYTEIYATIYQLIDDWSKTNTAKDTQKQFAAQFYTLALSQTVVYWLKQGMPQSPEELIALLSPIIKNALKGVAEENHFEVSP